jgi:hypothetical protein
MQILLGDTRKKTFVSELIRLGWGRVCTRDTPSPYYNEPWVFDNGAFSAWRKRLSFPAEKYLRRLDKAYKKGVPLFGVVPDLVGEGDISLEFSLSWLDRLPKEWNWYLALQDGMTWRSVTPYVHLFDGLFLGGTNGFKKTAPAWSKLSKDFEKPFHYGRCGTREKIRHAYKCKADSLDSSGPLWSVEKFQNFIKWIEEEEERERKNNAI